MNADVLFQQAVKTMGYSSVTDIEADKLVELALKFAIWPSKSTYEETPWLAPFAIRRIRVRVEPNAPGPKRDLWGLPTELGYFTDDNSLIKGLVLRKSLSPQNNAYGGAKISSGLVCCHIWSGTTGSPLLFSFVPNLVWLPKSLAPFSDAHLNADPHPIHDALKQASLSRYGTAHKLVRVASAWALLPQPSSILLPHYSPIELADDGKVSKLVYKRINKMTRFLTDILNADVSKPNRFSIRFHAGSGPGIDKSVLTAQEWLSPEIINARISELNECL
jgi:hypothetical protein